MSNENQEIEHVEAVVVTANALEQMERANIDIQISTALAHPRSMDKFYKRAEAMVTLDAETAQSCLYRRPVGKEGGKMVYAEGESIRLAEIVASSYGNIRVAGMITEMEPRHVKAMGIAHDLETNTAYKAEVVESTVNRHGVPFSERMRVVVAKAAQSKAIRDAVFRVVPKSLCKTLVNKAKEVAKGDAKTFESRRKGVVEWIKGLKIEPKRVWNAVGINGPEDITIEVLLLLAGLKTAIEEGDVTVNEAFPKPEAEQTGSTAERIKDHFADTDKKEPKPDKPKGRGRKAKQPKETAPSPPPEEPKSVKCPKCGKEADPATHKCESEPEEDKPVWKCLRCERMLKDNDKDIKNGQCGYCFGQVARL